MVTCINELANVFHEEGLPVICVRHQVKADFSDANLRDKKRGNFITVEGTEGVELLDELSFKQGDITILKNRYSAFFGTNLKQILAELGVDTLVVCGINTQACVRTTVIDAFQYDIETIIATDATTSWDETYHKTTMRYFRESMDLPLLSNEEIIQLIKSSMK